MPNWVECDFRVEGELSELRKFQIFAKDECLLSANKFIPYPKKFEELDKMSKDIHELESMTQKTQKEKTKLGKLKILFNLKGNKDGFNIGGYRWCLDNWGTKWGLCEVELVMEDESELEYTFETAWSPPLPIVKVMGEMFPKLKFELRYFEGGSGFNGLYIMEDGKVETNRQADYFGSRGG